MKIKYYFFIGTTAELIKIIPVMIRFEQKNIDYTIISSGQNNILASDLFQFIKKRPEIILSNKQISQSPVGLLLWFLKTFIRSFFIINKLSDKKNSVMIVHGDTISTVMGGILGKLNGLKIAHIEAGLRSFNFLQPFPEEIDRLLVSNMSDIHFCPNEWAINNIHNKRGLKINTKNNTLIDSLKIALNKNISSRFLSDNHGSKFFIFILHRQENLLNKILVDHLMNKVIEVSHKLHCLFILHEPTKKVLNDINIMKKLKSEKNITLLSRMSYLEFMQILSVAEFIITDGGSNQEECYYLGKPCLILRQKTERIEGLNGNILLGGSNIKLIDSFISNYKSFKRKTVSNDESPSLIITNTLLNL